MPALEIPCPNCGQLLKVPDRSLLGRKARCGKCRQKFVLQEPMAKVQEQPPARPSVDEFVAPVEISDLKRRERKEKREQPPPRLKARAVPAASSPTALGQASQETQPLPTSPPPAAAPPADLELSPVSEEDDFSPLARLAYQRKKQGKWNLVLSAVVAVVVLGGGLGWYAWKGSAPATRSARAATAAVKPVKEEPTDEAPVETKSKSSTGPTGASGSPTRGPPISLRLVPMGARIVIHLRPADLWQPGSAGEEFRACLGPLGVWLESQIKAQCLLEPAKIEEVLFALIPSSREEFETAVVVRARETLKRSALIDQFDGEVVERPRPHYLGSKKVYLIHDAKTFAIAPRDMADTLLESIDQVAVTSDGIQALISKTDRDRHFTLLAELEDVRTGARTLRPDTAQNLLGAAVDFLGDEVESLTWSLHLGDTEQERDLYSELIVRNRLTRSPPHLRDDLKKKLAALPADLLKLVYRTNPRKIGEKKIVGRLPIMVKVAEQSINFVATGRTVSLRCTLPERAGPNLALGTLLAWNQTNLPEYGKSGSEPPPSTSAPAAGGSIAERLKKKIDVEFRDDFLYAAVDFIGEETKVSFKLDGPGMRRVGVTQNEKQKFSMQQAPAGEVLDRILSPRKLVLIVDEQNNVATIASAEVAAEKKLKPFPLPSAAKNSPR